MLNETLKLNGAICQQHSQYVGYCRVVGNTTTDTTYIDIYCSLVSCTAALSTATESCNLKCVCHCFHPSGVDQTMVGE